MATTAEGMRAGAGVDARFRTCPYTGLKVHISAQTLIKANAVAAVVFLAIGGLFGLLRRADPLAGDPPAAGGLVLSGPDRARPRRAAGLDHLLRDRGALLRLGGPAQLAAWPPPGWPGSPSP